MSETFALHAFTPDTATTSLQCTSPLVRDESGRTEHILDQEPLGRDDDRSADDDGWRDIGSSRGTQYHAERSPDFRHSFER